MPLAKTSVTPGNASSPTRNLSTATFAAAASFATSSPVGWGGDSSASTKALARSRRVMAALSSSVCSLRSLFFPSTAFSKPSRLCEISR